MTILEIVATMTVLVFVTLISLMVTTKTSNTTNEEKVSYFMGLTLGNIIGIILTLAAYAL